MHTSPSIAIGSRLSNHAPSPIHTSPPIASFHGHCTRTRCRMSTRSPTRAPKARSSAGRKPRGNHHRMNNRFNTANHSACTRNGRPLSYPAPVKPRKSRVRSPVDTDQPSGQLILQQRHIRVHHELYELGEPYARLPAQHLAGLGRVTDQSVHFGRSAIVFVEPYVLFPLQPDMPKGPLAEFPDA